jgi:hypothetical protein
LGDFTATTESTRLVGTTIAYWLKSESLKSYTPAILSGSVCCF